MKCEICGMNINKKNYNFNRLAFLEENSVDNIMYCPFCGVSKSYLNEDENVITIEKGRTCYYVL